MTTVGSNHKAVDGADSPVSRMFAGRSIFITGASGFIGRVLLEKLLRSYQAIERIYILMRSKKNQLPSERLHKQLLKVPIFDNIRSMECGSKLLDKIVVIAGDIGQSNLGISEHDMKMMLEDKSLSIVFHSAATIKFDEPLKVSVNLNLIATKAIIEICRQLPNLISFCHVSTAYVNSDLKDNQVIEEKIYPMRDRPEQLMQLADIMDENLMQTLKIRLVDQRPNTYTYTKALAEHLIIEEASDLPVAIVRPSIVVASWREPLRGWIDNLNGPTGLILAIGKGLLRSMHATRSVKADIVPVDVVVNTMIASAFYTAKINNKLEVSLANNIVNSSNKHKEHKKGNTNLIKLETSGEPIVAPPIAPKTATSKQQQLKKEPPIVHCNSGDINPITWGEMEDMVLPIIRHYPSCQVLRYPFGTFKGNRYHDLFARILAHYLPALIIDMLCGMLGKKKQLLSIYYKLHCATAALSHFCNQNYNFQAKNMKLLQENLSEKDKRDLYMDMEEMKWTSFWDDYVLGSRRYVLKEADETLPEAKKSFLRAYYIEIGLRVLLAVILSACCVPLITRLSLTFTIRSALQTLHLYA